MHHQPRPPIRVRFLFHSLLLCLLFIGSMEACVVTSSSSSTSSTVQSQSNQTTQGQSPQSPANTSSNYQQAISGAPSLSDALTGNDGNQWDAQSLTGTGQCTFAANSYQASESQTGAEAFCLARVASFSNFTAQVQVTLLSGDTGGLVIRATSSNGTTALYAFGVNASGGYGFGLYTASMQNNGQATSQSISFSLQSTGQGGANAAKALRAGLNQSNILTIAAHNSSFDLYINGSYIDTVNDNTLSSGFIGVFAEAQTSATTAEFSMMQVWTR